MVIPSDEEDCWVLTTVSGVDVNDSGVEACQGGLCNAVVSKFPLCRGGVWVCDCLEFSSRSWGTLRIPLHLQLHLQPLLTCWKAPLWVVLVSNGGFLVSIPCKPTMIFDILIWLFFLVFLHNNYNSKTFFLKTICNIHQL